MHITIASLATLALLSPPSTNDSHKDGVASRAPLGYYLIDSWQEQLAQEALDLSANALAVRPYCPAFDDFVPTTDPSPSIDYDVVIGELELLEQQDHALSQVTNLFFGTTDTSRLRTAHIQRTIAQVKQFQKFGVCDPADPPTTRDIDCFASAGRWVCECDNQGRFTCNTLKAATDCKEHWQGDFICGSDHTASDD